MDTLFMIVYLSKNGINSRYGFLKGNTPRSTYPPLQNITPYKSPGHHEREYEDY